MPHRRRDRHERVGTSGWRNTRVFRGVFRAKYGPLAAGGVLMRSGQCLCGAVSVQAELASTDIQMCHCGQCQRWTGGGPLVSVRVNQIDIQGEEAIIAYQASEWGERVFCGTCGTTLWWKMQGKPVKYIAAGLLDDQSGLAVKDEIFVDHRPGWLPAWPDAKQSTEAEELAALHAYLEGESQ